MIDLSDGRVPTLDEISKHFSSTQISSSTEDRMIYMLVQFYENIKNNCQIIDEAHIIEKSDDEHALACLLVNDQVILSPEDEDENGTSIVVNCGDIFSYATADVEIINYCDGEIIDLYNFWKDDNHWGITKWLCFKRNMQPLKEIKRQMIKDNSWDSELENLPED